MNTIKQSKAIDLLEEILGHELTCFNDCTGNALTCPIEECMLCAVRDCRGNEPLHYHHDGCPYCYNRDAEILKDMRMK